MGNALGSKEKEGRRGDEDRFRDKQWISTPVNLLLDDGYIQDKYSEMEMASELPKETILDHQPRDLNQGDVTIKTEEVTEDMEYDTDIGRLQLFVPKFSRFKTLKRVPERPQPSVIEEDSLVSRSKPSHIVERMLHRQKFLFYRLYLAMSRQLEDETVEDTKESDENSNATTLNAIATEIPAQKIFKMSAFNLQIQTLGALRKTDVQVFVQSCATLVNIIADFPALSLANLMTGSAEHSAFTCIMKLCSDIVNDTAATDTELGAICALLLALGCASGRTGCLLQLSMILHTRKLTYPDSCLAACRKLWSRLKEHRVSRELSLLDTKLNDLVVRFEHTGAAANSPASIATDGEHIYLWDAHGLSKIGSGLQGTVGGRIVLHTPSQVIDALNPTATIFSAIYGDAIDVTSILAERCNSRAFANIDESKEDLFEYEDEDATLYVEYFIGEDEIRRNKRFSLDEPIILPPIGVDAHGEIRIEFALFGYSVDVALSLERSKVKLDNGNLHYGIVSGETYNHSDIGGDSSLYVRFDYNGGSVLKTFNEGMEVVMESASAGAGSSSGSTLLCIRDRLYLNLPGVCSETEFLVFTLDLQFTGLKFDFFSSDEFIIRDDVHEKHDISNSVLLENMEYESSAVSSEPSFTSVRNAFNPDPNVFWKAMLDEMRTVSLTVTFFAQPRKIVSYRIELHEACPISTQLQGRNSFDEPWVDLNEEVASQQEFLHVSLISTYQSYRLRFISHDDSPDLRIREISFFEEPETPSKLLDTKAVKETGTAVKDNLQGRSIDAMFTDGEFLFVVKENQQVIQCSLDTQLVRTTRLHEMDKKTWTQRFFYTNGDRINTLMKVNDRYKVLSFDALAGNLIQSNAEPSLPVDESIDRCVCYDPMNNLVWIYTPSQKLLTSFRNYGQSMRKSPNAELFSNDCQKVLESLNDGDMYNSIHLLGYLDKFSSYYAPDVTQCSSKGGHVPFCIDVDPIGLEILIQNIQKYAEGFCSGSLSTSDTYILLACLRIVTVYLSHSQVCATTTQKLLHPLESLIRMSSSGTVVQVALRLFIVGIDVFYPKAQDQLDLVLKNLQLYYQDEISSVDRTILTMLVRRLKSLDGMTELVQTVQVDTFLNELCRLSVSCHMKAIKQEETPEICIMVVELLASMVKAIAWNYSRDRKALDPLRVAVKHVTINSIALATELNESCDLEDLDTCSRIEHIVKNSLVGNVLPWLLSTITVHLRTSETRGTRQLIQLMQEFSGRISHILRLVGRLCDSAFVSEDLYEVITCTTTKKVEKTLESSHPYENNTHSLTEFRIPGATKMTLEFDQLCRAETGYDYVVFFKDATQTEFYGHERFTGRHGDHNWPGVDGNPPLIIESDRCYVHFHSDGSGFDWGWKFTATAEVRSTSECTSLHWLAQIEQTIAMAISTVSHQLITGENLTPYRQLENQNAHLIDSHLFQGGIQPEAQLSTFLEEIIDPPEGSNTAEVVSLLKTLTMQDQGNIAHVNTAVRAVAAAILHHRLLGMDAYALAQKKRDEPSSEMLRAWRNAQKMRRWFDLGDAADGTAHRPVTPSTEAAPRLKRQPSAYKGQSETAMIKLCNHVTRRAKFLLSLTPVSFSFVAGARKRWGLLAKYGHAMHGVDEAHDLVEKWYNVVTEFHAATQLKQIFQYRRSSSDRRSGIHPATVTEIVLEFVQSDADVEELNYLLLLRNIRAKDRMNGLEVLLELLPSCSHDMHLQSLVLESFAASIREISSSEYRAHSVHFLNGLNGCDGELRKGVSEVFGRLLQYVAALVQGSQSIAGQLRSENYSFSSAISVGSQSNSTNAHYNQLCISVLKACTMDYETPDHYLLHECRILPKLLVLLSRKESVQVRRVAQATLRHFLARFIAVDDIPSNSGDGLVSVEASAFQKQLLASLRLQLEGIVSGWTKEQENIDHLDLRRDSPGPCHPHIEFGSNFTIAFWIYIFEPNGPSTLKAGDMVRHGPDWADGDDDEERVGVVTEVEGCTHYHVRWVDSGETGTYAFDPELEFYEIVTMDNGPGGSIFIKGMRNLASEQVLRTPWSYFGLQLTDQLFPRFFVAIDADTETVVDSDSKLHSGCWTHLALTQQKNRFCYYVNGSLVSEHILNDQLFLSPESLKNIQVIESKHPYHPFTNRYWRLDFPGAKVISIRFDSNSQTNSVDDYVCFYKDDQHDEYYGDSKYYGGAAGTGRHFDDITIPSDHVIVYFHSGSRSLSYGWGFKLTATADPTSLDIPYESNFNTYPIYFGEPPVRVTDRRAADCCISDFQVFKSSKTKDDILGLVESSSNAYTNRPKRFPTHRALQILSLMHGCCETSIGRQFIATPKTINNLLALTRLSHTPALVQCSAIRVLQLLAPSLSVELVDKQMNTCNSSFVKNLLKKIGTALHVHREKPIKAGPKLDIEEYSAQHTFEMVKTLAEFLREAACQSDEWCDVIKRYIKDAIRSIPDILEACQSDESGVYDKIQQLYATTALLGGLYSAVSTGSRIKCCLDIDGKECVEVGTIVEVCLRNDTHMARAVLDCEPTEIYDVPLADVVHFNDKEDERHQMLLQFYGKLGPEFIDLAHSVCRLLESCELVASKTSRYKSKVSREEKVQIVESEHPYRNDLDVTYPIDFPGADEILIEFDPQSRTEFQCDFLRFNKRDQAGYYGSEKYSGELMTTEDEPLILKIPTGSVDVYFHSDSSNTDWGFKLTARAMAKSEMLPPERPPSAALATLSDLRCRLMKVLSIAFSRQDTLPLFKPLLKSMVHFSIETYEGRPVRPMSKTQIFESKHPYCNSISEYMSVSFHGATLLKIIFDPASRTENGCDYVVFFKDKSLQERWGEQQYTGRGGAENWPGASGRPPLMIPSDTFTLYWCTDSSNVDWGWKFIVTAEFPSVQPIDSPLEQLDQRAYYITESTYERMKPQEMPPDSVFEGFEVYDPQDEVKRAKIRCNEFPNDPLLAYDLSSTELLNQLASETALRTFEPFPEQQRDVEKKERFRVQCSGGLYVRRKNNDASPTLGLLLYGSAVEAIDQSGDWLKIEFESDSDDVDGGWCRRRNGDEFYLVRDISLLDEESIILGIDDEDTSSASHRKYFTEVTKKAESPNDFSPHFILEDFKGQMDRLCSLSYDTTQACAIKYCRMCVDAFFREYPADSEIQLHDVGTPIDIIRLILQAHRNEATSVLKTLNERLSQMIRQSEELVNQLLQFSMNSFQYGLQVLPKGRAVVRSVESNHPYDDNMNQYWSVSIPGAKRIKIVFDPRTRTETGCDWLCFYTNADHHSVHGEERYTGRGGGENWPGFGGRPPLWIESDHFEAYFHSDGSGTDWGFQFTAYGVIVEETVMDSFIQPERQNEIIQEGLFVSGVSCWILEMFSSALIPFITQDLFIVLTQVLQHMPQSTKLRVLYLFTSMATNDPKTLLNQVDKASLQKLIELLKAKLRTQYRAEDSNEVRSIYLQALVQCTVALEIASEKTELDPSLDEENDVNRVLAWHSDSGKCSQLELSNGNRCVRKVGSKDNPSSVRAELGYASGIHTWEIVVSKCTAHLYFGISFEKITTDAILGYDSHSHGYGNQIFSSKLSDKKTVPFGTKIYEGDIIGVRLDLNRGTLTYRRNGALLGLALSPIGGGGTIETKEKLQGMYYPALTLCSIGDEVTLRPCTESDFNHGALHTKQLPDRWYRNFCFAVQMLMDLKQTRAPLSLLEKELVPKISAQETIVRESIHPYIPGENLSEVIEIPHASEIEVKIDPKTQIGLNDRVIFSFLDGSLPPTVLTGIECANLRQSSHLISSPIQIGDMVVRGDDWDFGNEDGGPGFRGQVTGVEQWKEKPNAGIRVEWIETRHENIYRFGYNGFYDVRLDRSTANSNNTRPDRHLATKLVFPTNAIEFKVESAAVEERADQPQGTLRFDPTTEAIEYDQAFQMSLIRHDITIQLWFRPDLESGVSDYQCLVQLEEEDIDARLIPAVVVLLYDPVLHLVSFRLGTATDTTFYGQICSHEALEPAKWCHITAILRGVTMAIYLNGQLSETDDLDTFPDRSLSTPYCKVRLGKYVNSNQDSSMLARKRLRDLKMRPLGAAQGHIYDCRIWDVARSKSHIRQDVRGTLVEPPTKPSSVLTNRCINRTGSVYATMRLGSEYKVEASGQQLYYYEVTILSGGAIHIGWAFDACTPSRKTTGIGDCMYSFAVDLSLHVKWYNGAHNYENCPTWQAGDRVGCCLDLKNGTISYWLNGEYIGVAFTRTTHHPLQTPSRRNMEHEEYIRLSSPMSRDSGLMDDDLEDLDLSTPEELLELGFSRRKCQLALRESHGDVAMALDYLLEHPESSESEDEDSDEDDATCSLNDVALERANSIQDEESLWSGYGCLRPAVSLPAQGTQGVEWHVQEFLFPPPNVCPINTTSDQVTYETFDHVKDEWVDVEYRHQLLDHLSPNVVGHWDLISPESEAWDEQIVSPLDHGDMSSYYGYHISFVPHYRSRQLSSFPRFKKCFEEFAKPMKSFSKRQDRELMKYINRMVEVKGLGADQLLRTSWSDLAPDATELVKWPILADLSRQDKSGFIPTRFRMIQDLNRSISQALPLIDLHLMGKSWSLATLLSLSRDLIFSIFKQTLWKNALSDTGVERSTIDLHLNRPKAMRHKALNQADTDVRHTLFSQAFRQLHNVDPSVLRRQGKVYHVQFLGENAEDAGGPYRETFTQYCTELESNQLHLLLPTPNARHNVGTGREKYILNSSARSALDMDLFRFLGQLMGIAMRGNEGLHLHLASIIWKRIVREDVGLEDVEQVDAMLMKSMQKMKTIDTLGVTEELFEDVVMESFTVLSCADELVELKPQGKETMVTFDTRHEFAELVESYRIHEFDLQASAIQDGLRSIVPLNLLVLFTADEVETMVCGVAEIDVDLLQQCTEYSSCAATDPHVGYFWECLREFSHEERSAFLRFTWGRSRLPSRPDQFPQWFKLQSFNKSPPDQYLPVAHTCFFALELPRYSSKQLLQEKLRYAIHNCQAIDMDGDAVAANQLGWED